MTRRSCSSQVTDELMAVGLSLGVRRGGRSRTQRFTPPRSIRSASRGAKEECHGPVVGKPVGPVYGDVRRPSGRGQSLDVRDGPRPTRRHNPPNRDRTHRIPPVTLCDDFHRPRRVATPYPANPRTARPTPKGMRAAPLECGKVTDVGTASRGCETTARAISSAGEHCLHTAGVTGSIPVSPTSKSGSTSDEAGPFRCFKSTGNRSEDSGLLRSEVARARYGLVAGHAGDLIFGESGLRGEHVDDLGGKRLPATD